MADDIDGNIQRFTLKDADGNPHEYVLVRHGATRGQKIMWQLVALGVEPLAQIGAGIVSAAEVFDKLGDLLNVAKGEGAGDPSLEAIRPMLDAVDLKQLGANIRNAILSTDMPQLTLDLVANMTRDAKGLDKAQNFDAAFQGNYVELQQAVWQSVVRNRFISLPDMS